MAKFKPLSCVCGCRIPMRFIVATFCVLGVIVGYGHRQALSVTITRMTTPERRNVSQDCPSTNETIQGEGIEGGAHNWNEHQQEFMLAAFYFGYFIGQIPCGILADTTSPKLTYLTGVLISSMFCALTPLIINETPWYVLCVIRIIQGIVQSVTYPSMSVLIAHWVPPSERATIGGFSFGSNALGAVLGNLLTGLLMTSFSYWPSAFYFWGLVGVLWCLGFLVWIYDTPSSHPNITEREKAFLEKEMAHYVKLKPPWKYLLTDKAVWSLIIGQIGHDFTFYLAMTNMPKYFSDVLHMKARNIAIVTAVPFGFMWLNSVLCGRLMDYGIKKRNWSVKWSRRSTTFVAFIVPNSLLCLMVYQECDKIMAALCFSIALFFKGPHFCGFKVNHMDITVNFNGIVMSMVNTSGCLGGFLAPMVVSYVAPKNRLYEWKRVVWIIWGLACVFTTYYFFSAQATRAKWDVPKDELEAYMKDREKEAAAKADKHAHKAAKKEAKKAEKAGTTSA